ncbi:ABC transporter substrate-binding protein [Nakamurella antarctica]|uniref:ABC transporter substrate-binding protein n=1 Tax=Nakamurella antarctica TaxID=1902245 RepID=A0A3G8ZNX5_9ACTN|nr:ABC transporter substrate-binding protein [Nakamurella antarctica]AZI58963.1 ABC transporter substrate-binding protein [Nakamurella antarctica]
MISPHFYAATSGRRSSSRSRHKAPKVLWASMAIIGLAVAGCGTATETPTAASSSSVAVTSETSSAPASTSSSAAAESMSSSAAETSAAMSSEEVSASAPGMEGGSATPVTPVLSITNADGTEITFDKIPERIVCLTGLCDDVLFELGLVPVGTSTPGLLALPEYLGAESASITSITGSFGGEDVESIAALTPDLVVGLAGAHDQMSPSVVQFAPLLLLDVTSYEDSISYLRSFGALLDKADEQVIAENSFNASLAKAREASSAGGLKKMKALTMYASGGGTGVNTSDDLLGGLMSEIFEYPWPNKGGGWDTAQAYSTEEILAVNPDIIFIQSFTADAAAPKYSQELADNPVWSRIAAVQSGKVIEVDTALWTAGRGPRALSLVLDEAVAAAS